MDVGIYCSTLLDNSSTIYDPMRVDIDHSTRYTIVNTTEDNAIIGNYLSNNNKGIVCRGYNKHYYPIKQYHS